MVALDRMNSGIIRPIVYNLTIFLICDLKGFHERQIGLMVNVGSCARYSNSDDLLLDPMSSGSIRTMGYSLTFLLSD